MFVHRSVCWGLAVTAIIAVPHTVAFAQTGTIAGVVRDSTGAVLPGVTVEASSPALIEKVRGTVTDGDGQYKVVELRPGIYTVAFSLPGFSSVKREGIELSAGFTANVVVEMRVGAVEETVTVSGQSPLIDVQNVTQQQVLPRTVVDTLPTSKSLNTLAVLIPGAVVKGGPQDVGGSQGVGTSAYLSIHGSRGAEMPLLLDGMRFNNTNGTGGGFNTVYRTPPSVIQEMAIETSGTSAEAIVSGIRVDVIPKTGANVFHGSFFTAFTTLGLQSDNTPANLKAQGIRFTAEDKIFDIDGAAGGPILLDRLWYYGGARYWGQRELPVNTFSDVDPLDFAYTPDRSRPVTSHPWQQSTNLRLTWQASANNKFGVFLDYQHGLWGTGGSATTAPEAGPYLRLNPTYLAQATWTSPVSSRFFIDVGTSNYIQNHGVVLGQDGVPSDPTMFSVFESSTGTRFRAPVNPNWVKYRTYSGKANVSYVTGSNLLKVGTQLMWGSRVRHTWNNNDMSLNLLRGVPSSVTVYTTPYAPKDVVKLHLGQFIHDQLTLKRLTFNMGLRFDYLNAAAAEVHLPPARFVGARDFAEVPNAPKWKDISPRLGVAWDLFGKGRTAMKVSVGRYVFDNTTDLAGQVNPINASVNQTNRSWTDSNADFFPQENELGPLQNGRFGSTNITTTFDPDVLTGWGHRPYNWEISAGIQHELRPGLSANAAYVRHWVANFLVVDNLAVLASDYDPYCITAPRDSRLPDGGGSQLCGFFDINPSKFGRVENRVILAPDGSQSDVYNGVDLTTNLRLPRGVLLQGGVSIGRQVTDNCDVVGRVDNSPGSPASTSLTPGNFSNLASPSTLYCHIAPPLQANVKLLGVYPLPWWDLQVSGTYQDVPGPQITASYAAPTAAIAPSLGRNLSGNAASANVELIEPGTLFGSRLHQLDARVTKTVKLRRLSVQAQVDIYNVFNASAVLAQNNQFGPAWLTPTSVLLGRMVKLGAQLSW